MLNQNTYTLEYFVSKEKFSEREELENYVKQVMEKFIKDLTFEIDTHEGNYLILHITSTSKIIDACHDKLDIERDWAFRSKDELGDFLRESAYPILANIETTLRNFINQAMISVLGFNWWNLFIPENIRKKVEAIEIKAGKSNTKLHHPIEFTLFEDLIRIVTAEFQAWPDDRIITFSGLVELLSSSNSIEEIRLELENRRKIMSFWDNVFSNYFEDKEAWSQLKEKIENSIIPIRNKVMHHRLIREYELRELSEFNDEVNHIIGTAKHQLSDYELEEALRSANTILGMGLSLGIAEALQNMASVQASVFDSEAMKALQNMASVQASVFDSETMKALQNIANTQNSVLINQLPKIIARNDFRAKKASENNYNDNDGS